MLVPDPPAIRYIKLGPGGAFADEAFREGVLPLAFPDAPRDLCAAGDWAKVKDGLVRSGRAPEAAAEDIRELRDFYELPHGSLWVTMTRGHLWWCLAGDRIRDTGGTESGIRRFRDTTGGWSRTASDGTPLVLHSLSSALTKTAGYRRTICSVEAGDYLLRRLGGKPNPLHVRVSELEGELASLALRLIGELHWADFETLVDLILVRNGWQRVTSLGGTMPDVDLVAIHPMTGERAWVLIKTGTTQAELEKYVERFRKDGSCKRFIFAGAKPRGPLEVCTGGSIEVWARMALAERVMAAGLLNWVRERTLRPSRSLVSLFGAHSDAGTRFSSHGWGRRHLHRRASVPGAQSRR